MLFDKEGILNIDELVAQRPTFRKIMEDQIVTDDELTNQANLVVNFANTQAYRFYLHMGYKVIGRDEFDSFGKSFPIIHLQQPSLPDSKL